MADGFAGEAFTMRFIPMREDVDGLDPYRSGNTLQGEPLWGNYPPGEELKAEYRASLAAADEDRS